MRKVVKFPIEINREQRQAWMVIDAKPNDNEIKIRVRID